MTTPHAAKLIRRRRAPSTGSRGRGCSALNAIPGPDLEGRQGKSGPGVAFKAEQRVPANPLQEPAAAESTALREGLSCITGSHYDAQSKYSLRVWVAALLPHASHNTLCSRNRASRGTSRKRDPPLRDFRTKWRYAEQGWSGLSQKMPMTLAPAFFAPTLPGMLHANPSRLRWVKEKSRRRAREAGRSYLALVMLATLAPSCSFYFSL
jgi:hypothetical protein